MTSRDMQIPGLEVHRLMRVKHAVRKRLCQDYIIRSLANPTPASLNQSMIDGLRAYNEQSRRVMLSK